MKLFALLFSIVTSTGVANAAPLPFSAQGLRGTDEVFLPHAGPGRYDSYLALNLPFAPAAELRSAVEAQFRVTLKHRGEAHVTVVTPVEFWDVLKPLGMTIQEIDQIALESGLQQLPVSAVCLGRGQLVINSILESTFYVVVKSPELVALRARIQQRFEELGGTPGAFNAETFYPHITLGYTERDLHDTDGVFKDDKTCVEDLVVQ